MPASSQPPTNEPTGDEQVRRCVYDEFGFDPNRFTIAGHAGGYVLLHNPHLDRGFILITLDDGATIGRYTDEPTARVELTRRAFAASRQPRHPEIVVRLTGTDGNAFRVIGVVRGALVDAGIDATEFLTDATSGDYQRLLQTCMAWVTVE